MTLRGLSILHSVKFNFWILEFFEFLNENPFFYPLFMIYDLWILIWFFLLLFFFHFLFVCFFFVFGLFLLLLSFLLFFSCMHACDEGILTLISTTTWRGQPNDFSLLGTPSFLLFGKPWYWRNPLIMTKWLSTLNGVILAFN